jgi:hypothetical protein
MQLLGFTEKASVFIEIASFTSLCEIESYLRLVPSENTPRLKQFQV